MIHYIGDTLRLVISIKQLNSDYKKFSQFEQVYVYLYTDTKVNLAFCKDAIEKHELLQFDEDDEKAIIFIDIDKSKSMHAGDLKILFRLKIKTEISTEQKTIILLPGLTLVSPDIPAGL